MINRRLPGRVLLALAATVLATGIVAADAELPGHEGDALSVASALTLSDAVDLALANYPATLELQARSGEADAWADRGRSWIANRPSLLLRYQTDRWGSNNGLDEYEAGIELPLWNWGARSASQDFGDAMSAESSAARLALRWQLAGLLRSLLWDVALAENDHALARQARDTASRLAGVVARRHELGDVALSDVLLANSTLLEAQTAVIDASSSVLDTERAYRSVTGLDRRPPFAGERLSERHDVEADHPALVFANAEVLRAEASVAVAERTAQSGTNLFVGARRERPAFGTEMDDSVGIILNVPFGGSSHRQTEISAAASAAARARAKRNQQLRSLTLSLHEAAHGLNVVHQNLSDASERLSLAERSQEMGEIAYEKGEFELIDLLKVQASAIAARRQVARLEIDEKRQTAFYNQAVGQLP
jgi:cobalt-zinc-cadmium efflux system outer membrane protein